MCWAESPGMHGGSGTLYKISRHSNRQKSFSNEGGGLAGVDQVLDFLNRNNDGIHLLCLGHPLLTSIVEIESSFFRSSRPDFSS